MCSKNKALKVRKNDIHDNVETEDDERYFAARLLKRMKASRVNDGILTLRRGDDKED